MKNLRVKIIEGCAGNAWRFAICEGKKILMKNFTHKSNGFEELFWLRKAAAIRNAKAMAKHIGIKFDPKIIKQHDC